MIDETKIIFPNEIMNLKNGEQIKITPLSFSDFVLHSELVASMVSKIQGLKETIGEIEAEEDLFKMLLKEASTEVQQLMMVVLGKPQEWFTTITIHEGLAIFAIIYEQNVDEDAKKNLRRFLALFSTISSGSSTPSRSSSPTATKKAK